MSLGRVVDSTPEREETSMLAFNAVSLSALSVSTLREASSISVAASPSFPTLALKGIEQLLNIALDFRVILTDATEQVFCLRGSLDALVSTLHTCRHCVRRQRTLCIVPRLVVAGPRQSGKTTVFDFLLQRNANIAAKDTTVVSSVDVSVTAAKDGRTNAHQSLLKPTLLPHVEYPSVCVVDNHSIGGFSDTVTTPARRACGSIRRGTIEIIEPEKSEEANGDLLSISESNNISPDRNIKFDVDENVEDGGEQELTHLPFLNDTTSREHCRGDDGPKSNSSFRSAMVSSLSERRGLRFVEVDASSPLCSPTPQHAATMFSGTFDTTIADRILMKKNNTGPGLFRRKRGSLYKHHRKASFLQKKSSIAPGTNVPSSYAFVTFTGLDAETVNVCHATSWVLQEVEGDLVRSERDDVHTYTLPDTIGAETVFFTVPSDVVGTHRMTSFMGELFGSFLPQSADASRDGGRCDIRTPSPHHKRQCAHGDKNEAHAQNIRQLISDMTFFILTFSDAILTRVEGVLSLDERLTNRPPPMSASLPELVTLFQKDMLHYFGVHVESWQIIPFSGSMSRAALDVLTTMYEMRVSRFGFLDVEFGDLSLCSTVSLPNIRGSANGSVTTVVSNDADPGLQAVVNNYCDIVYGKRFNERKNALSAEQLKEMVWNHALTSVWQDSGARQLLSAVKSFEWSSLLHFLSHTAVSLVIWCEQLRRLLWRVRELLRGFLSECRNNLRETYRIHGAVDMAIKRLRTESSPRKFAQSIWTQLQKRFEDLTINFWMSLTDLFEVENQRLGLSPCNGNSSFPTTRFSRRSSLQSSSPALALEIQQARDRLRKQYHQFLHIYIETRYETQFSQLQRILEEEKESLGRFAFISEEEKGEAGTAGRLEKEEEEAKMNLLSDLRGATTPKRTASAATAASTSSTHAMNLLEDARHHIPFVAQNAQELKMTMRKEFSLQLARLNTEVINYFMAEIAAALSEFVEIGDINRKTARTEMLGVAAAIDFRESYDGEERKLLRLMLHELSFLRLVGMQPSQELQTFVTGLRRTLCQDQISLYTQRNELKGNKQRMGECVVRTSAYLSRAMRDGELRQTQPIGFMQSITSPTMQRLQECEGMILAPMKMAGVLPQPEEWMQRCMSNEFRETAPYSSKTTATKTAVRDTAGEEELKEGEESQNAFFDDMYQKTNPAWFLLAVWQNALSHMSFSPWLQVQSMRYTSLLNNIALILFKGHEQLDAQINKEIQELQLLMRNFRVEIFRTKVDIPTSLKRFTSSANAVAREMKSAKTETLGPPT